VVGLAWSNGPESYAGGSVATGRIFHAGQVKDDDPDEEGHSGPYGWGLGVRPTTSSRRKVDDESNSEMPRRGLINRRRAGYKENSLTLGIRNVRTLFKFRAVTSLPSQLKKYRLEERIPNKVLNGKFHNTRPAGKPRRRWEDVVRRDTSQILGIRGWMRWA